LSKLVEFAKAGHLRLLVTDIAVGEVKSQLRELLAEASSSVTKHSGILEQLGASTTVERMKDQTAALTTLEAAFDAFLRHTNAVNVPLISDVRSVLEDYFARRPPFSTKKKAEFPDAISIASIAGASSTTRQLMSFPRILTCEDAAPKMGRCFIQSPS
jgi:hypothetical protein